MSLEEEIKAMEDAISKMVYVKDGDYVYSDHPNSILEFLKHCLNASKLLYEMFKEKTGKELSKVEVHLGIAEDKLSKARTVSFGDVVLSIDHNYLVDSAKAIEFALLLMEQELE